MSGRTTRESNPESLGGGFACMILTVGGLTQFFARVLADRRDRSGPSRRGTAWRLGRLVGPVRTSIGHRPSHHA